MSTNIRALLSQVSEQYPNRLAISDGASQITFAQLDEKVTALTGSFRSQGVKCGTTVLFLCLPGVDFYSAMLAVFALGARVELIDPGFSRGQILSCLRQVKPDFVVGLPAFFNLFRGLGVRFLTLRRSSLEGLPEKGSPTIELTGDEEALVTFTSGTTGSPRMIVRSQSLLVKQHEVLTRCLDLEASRTVLTTLPVFVLSNLAAGLSSVLVKRGRKHIKQALDLLLTHHCDRIIAAPDFLDALRDEARQRGLVLSFVRSINVGGGPVFPRAVEKWRKVFAEASILAVYGGSEAEPICTLNMDRQTIAESIKVSANGGGLPAGLPEVCRVAICPTEMFSTRQEFSEEEFKAGCLKPFERGEVLVTGEHVVKGGSADKVRVGDTVYHRTGDAGYLSEDGGLYLVGRARYGGEKFPLEVEAMVRAFSQVKHCAYLPSENILFVDQNLPGLLRERLELANVEVRRIKSIPVDRRHGSKVVYSELENLVAGLRV